MNEERDETTGLPEDAEARPRPSQAEGSEHPGEKPAERPPRPSQAEGEREDDA
jgi:hypothetical protein